MWKINAKNQREFTGGKEGWRAAARIAAGCPHFRPDDEDEMTADEEVSCYNCLYRRWTMDSFLCNK